MSDDIRLNDPFTYGDLLAQLHELSPQQLQQPVRFLEPYDDEPAMLHAAGLATADEDIPDIEEGGLYLHT